MENPLYMEVLMGESSINGPCSIAMCVVPQKSNMVLGVEAFIYLPWAEIIELSQHSPSKAKG